MPEKIVKRAVLIARLLVLGELLHHSQLASQNFNIEFKALI